jgi:hypothetical protein
MQDRGYELRRIHIPRTSVNKGKKAQTGHGRMLTKALKEVPSMEPAGAGKTALGRRGRITTACTGNESPVGGRASLVDVGIRNPRTDAP